MADSTVRQVLTLPVFATMTSLGGRTGMDRAVNDARAVSSRGIASVQRNNAVFYTAVDSLDVELALPRLNDRGVSLVVIGIDVLRSTQWLADRLDLPLVQLAEVDLVGAALDVKMELLSPEWVHGLMCASVARRLARIGDTPARVASTLGSELKLAVSIVGPSMIVIAGDALPKGVSFDLLAPQTVFTDEAELVVVPAPASTAGGAQLACVVHAPKGCSRGRAEMYGDVAQLAVLRLSSWSARSALSAAWDQASQGALLTQLLAAGELTGARAEQALALGWELSGHHIAVVARPDSQAVDGDAHPADVLIELQHNLAGRGVSAPVIPFGDGWVWWTTDSREPNEVRARLWSNEIRQLTVELSSYRLVAGISSPRIGTTGLSQCVAEAGRLARLAGYGAGRRQVEVADEASPRHFVLDAIADDQTVRRSQLLLAPLQGRPELLDTLSVYLMSECATATTAVRLGLHRNTISKRLGRIEYFLGLDLADEDTRLALRLACRAS